MCMKKLEIKELNMKMNKIINMKRKSKAQNRNKLLLISAIIIIILSALNNINIMNTNRYT